MTRYRRTLIQLLDKSLVVTIPWELVKNSMLRDGMAVNVVFDPNNKIIKIQKQSAVKTPKVSSG
jgi:antitoxin component of MazEF toxin-antitoxin module